VRIIFNHFKQLKNFKFNIENKGEQLVITAKGKKEEIAVLEKKLKALHELTDGCCCCGDNDCC
jgi:hypothetical protein